MSKRARKKATRKKVKNRNGRTTPSFSPILMSAQMLKKSLNKVSSVDKAEAMHKNLGIKGFKLDPQLKKPKYFKMLCRIRDGLADPAVCNAYVNNNEDKLEGPISRVLEAYETPRTVYKASSISAPDRQVHQASEFIVMERRDHTTLIFNNGKELHYDPTQWIFVSLIEKRELPVDMRKWDNTWTKYYFKAIFGNSRYHQNTSQDRLRGQRLFNSGTILDKIHHIRRINPKPSKAQLQRIERERSESKNILVDNSFSLEQ
jgi:hypothetical protein